MALLSARPTRCRCDATSATLRMLAATPLRSTRFAVDTTEADAPGHSFGRVAVVPGRGGYGAGDADPIATPADASSDTSTATPAKGGSGAPPAPPAPQTCSPATALTWANFTGSPSAKATISAYTGYDFSKETDAGGDLIRATFAPARSWVRARWKTPTDSKLNGCDNVVADCEKYFPPGSVGASYSLPSAPSATCPAAIRAAPGTDATSKSECTSVIRTECMRVAQAESDRLLAHERAHLALACALANKGTTAIRASTLTGDAALAQVRYTDGVVTKLYDSETDHGCKPTEQGSWNTEIAGGLPSHPLQAQPKKKK